MNRMMRWFTFAHLKPGKMQDISSACASFAKLMDESLAEGAEKTAGLRKLVEAKDCFVRAVIEESDNDNRS